MKQILLIDNYDSFSYNLVQYLQYSPEIQVTVVRNDVIRVPDIRTYDGVVISPGPGLPKESGNLPAIFAHAQGLPPTLGICLGLQAMAEGFGARITQLEKVYHAVQSNVSLTANSDELFVGLERTFIAGRYHSWVVDQTSLKDRPLDVTCRDESGTIMGLRHRTLPIHGVQFHPESVMTPCGRQIIQNFIQHIVKS